jgi:hypothetical protein
MPNKLKKKLKKNEFYCVQCRRRKACKKDDICFKDIKNKKRGYVPALKCKCNACGGKLYKFIKESAARKASKDYNYC